MAVPTIDFQHDQAFSPALSRVIATRTAQIDMGHTAQADDDIGPNMLIAKARGKVLLIVQQAAKEADHNLQMCRDMTMGNVECLTAAEAEVLDRRLATAAALIIAAMDTLARGRAS